jgi:hypothetical protein
MPWKTVTDLCLAFVKPLVCPTLVCDLYCDAPYLWASLCSSADMMVRLPVLCIVSYVASDSLCWFMVPSLVLEVYIGCSVPTLQH